MDAVQRAAYRWTRNWALLLVGGLVVWPPDERVPLAYTVVLYAVGTAALCNAVVWRWFRRIARRQDRELREAAQAERQVRRVKLSAPSSVPPMVVLPPNASYQAVQMAHALATIAARSQMILAGNLAGGPVTWVHKTPEEPPGRRVIHADGSPCSPQCQARWQS